MFDQGFLRPALDRISVMNSVVVVRSTIGELVWLKSKTLTASIIASQALVLLPNTSIDGLES